MFEAAGWEVVTLKWGRRLSDTFRRPGGPELRDRLESMPNEEYQRLLRAAPVEVPERLLDYRGRAALQPLVESMRPSEVGELIRDLGGHDLALLSQAFNAADRHRPTVMFAYTIKGRELPTEGHPNNHSALLTHEQMDALARRCDTSLEDPWQTFSEDSDEGHLCRERRTLLGRIPEKVAATVAVPTSLAHPHRKPVSTQAAFGRLLADLHREVPEVARRIVTCSPDVASSTNLGGWINKSGVWSVDHRRDWFADDQQRVLRWAEDEGGQHIELGIAETNLVGLVAELGATWSRWGERLIPIATLYDPFVARALEPWSYGIYAGGQSIVVGTPSGVTLAPEGGAHQSVTTPSIGLEQPGCIAWEPAFATDLEWCLLHAMGQVGVPGGSSAYFRLSTRPIDPGFARLPEDPVLLERRRTLAVTGGYRLTTHAPRDEQVTLVGVGAILPEVLAAAQTLGECGVKAGVVCLTSPDLVFRSFQRRGRVATDTGGDIVEALFPRVNAAPLVTVLDGHPHTLAFLAGVRGDPIRCLGVSGFGQSSDLAAAYRLHGIDAPSIVDSALALLGR
jgi:pyruvate dehydrogenase E1 component